MSNESEMVTAFTSVNALKNALQEIIENTEASMSSSTSDNEKKSTAKETTEKSHPPFISTLEPVAEPVEKPLKVEIREIEKLIASTIKEKEHNLAARAAKELELADERLKLKVLEQSLKSKEEQIAKDRQLNELAAKQFKTYEDQVRSDFKRKDLEYENLRNILKNFQLQIETTQKTEEKIRAEKTKILEEKNKMADERLISIIAREKAITEKEQKERERLAAIKKPCLACEEDRALRKKMAYFALISYLFNQENPFE